MDGPTPPKTDRLVDEFAVLNRRKLVGGPPLDVRDLERWQELRQTLEQQLGDGLGGLLAQVERRSHMRFSSHLAVAYRSGDELRSACLGNVSEGGIFVATHRPLSAGARLRLSITTLGGSVEMSGVVAWARPSPGPTGPAGMGIRFDELDDAQRHRVAQIVQTAEAGGA